MKARILIAKLLLLMPWLSWGSEAALRDFLLNVESLQANFSQRVVDDTGMTLDYSRGVVSLKRPGKFRWDYAAEEGIPGQQLVADGESIFLFDPDLEQVTKRTLQDAINQVPSLVLVEDGSRLDETFSISEIGLTDGLSWVGLKPKSEDASYQQLMLGFNNNSLREIQMLDGLGNETKLNLTESRVNQALDSALFDFVVPEGVDLLSE